MTRIMIVDDNRTTTQTLCALVGRWGYEAVPAFDGAQALAALEKELVDIVVTDLRMPQIDDREIDVDENERGNTPSA
jgi:CheY-like chemotaxis protein